MLTRAQFEYYITKADADDAGRAPFGGHWKDKYSKEDLDKLWARTLSLGAIY